MKGSLLIKTKGKNCNKNIYIQIVCVYPEVYAERNSD